MKPELEIISLMADEAITIEGYGVGATPDVSANPFNMVEE